MSYRISDTRCRECNQRPASSSGLCGFCESKLSIGGQFSGSGWIADPLTAIGYLDFAPNLEPDEPELEPEIELEGRCTALMNDDRTIIMLRVDGGEPWTEGDLVAVIKWIQQRRKERRG